MKPELTTQQAPVTIYVAWHALSEDADDLARAIFRWFRGDPYDLEACGSGIPVLFRAWQPASPMAVPVDLPKAELGCVRVVVPLIDEHLAASRQWRHFVHRCVGRARYRGNTIVFPVALHPGAYEIAGAVASLNFVRADGGDAGADESAESRRARRAVRVLNQLTDAMARLLAASNGGFQVRQFDRPAEKISVFVSHAREDGARIAAALRDEIQGRGQLAAFYDENDLAWGFDWRSGLDQALRQGNALLLVVLTDRYASRPWCRHEVRTMRSIHTLPGDAATDARVCKLAPVVVVDALQQRSLDHLPDLGPAPVFRWRDGCASQIVDAIVRQVLQYAHDLQRAQFVARRIPHDRRPSTWVVNGTPDLRIAAEVRIMAQQAKVHDPRLVFPGPGVTRDTMADWQRLFPEMVFQRFDDVEMQW